MKRFPQLKKLIFVACLVTLPSFASATEIEERKGKIEVLETTTTVQHNPSDKVELDVDKKVILKGFPDSEGLQLPEALIKKLDGDQLESIIRAQMKKPEGLAEIIFDQNIIVPGIVFTTIAGITFMMLYFSYRKRRDLIDTLRMAIQSGQTLPTSFLESLETKKKPSPDSDLRKAVLLIAVGLAGGGFLAAMGHAEVGRAWAIGLVPTFVGIAYLFLWRQSQKNPGTGNADADR